MDLQGRLYPESRVGGFSRADGGVEFYQRVAALLRPEMIVLDFGAGRGSFLDDRSTYRRDLARMQGRVASVIGVDVDDAVLRNPSLDEAYVVKADGTLPLADESVDLVVSSFVFEHLGDPGKAAGELERVLRPGGWVCARTPNKWGYIGVGARLVPNSLHVRMLRRLQPGKNAEDTFPTAYRLNAPSALRKYFPGNRFAHFIYTQDSEPAYFGGSKVAWRTMQVLFRLTPPALGATLFIFLQKRPGLGR